MSGMTTKQCCHCQREKSVDQFFHSSVVKDGYRSRCKECEKGHVVTPRDARKTCTEKRCVECGETKPIGDFYLCRGRPNSHCKRCHNRMTMKNYQERTDGQRARYNKSRREHPEISRRRRNELLQKYGLTESEFHLQFQRQDGLCAICQNVMKRACIDHCHTFGHTRGLLCSQCNAGLGYFYENTQHLERAIAYLETGGVWDHAVV